jgi:hypothetical protein
MRIHGPKWTKKNEARKKEIFKGLIKEGHCDYCGTRTKGKHLSEHFIPTNNSKLQLYGAENGGNIFVSCAPCNRSKHNHHPISWMKGEVSSRKSRPYTYDREERLEKFILFYEEFKYKLKANKKLIHKIEEVHALAVEKHNELHNSIVGDSIFERDESGKWIATSE